jgi:hypothetical protein
MARDVEAFLARIKFDNDFSDELKDEVLVFEEEIKHIYRTNMPGRITFTPVNFIMSIGKICALGLTSTVLMYGGLTIMAVAPQSNMKISLGAIGGSVVLGGITVIYGTKLLVNIIKELAYFFNGDSDYHMYDYYLSHKFSNDVANAVIRLKNRVEYNANISTDETSFVINGII